jgi:hypothetical protein
MREVRSPGRRVRRIASFMLGKLHLKRKRWSAGLSAWMAPFVRYEGSFGERALTRSEYVL